MIPPHKHKQEENVDSWLMSYADMITLLLCFFIIFVSVSEPKKDQLAAITQGIANRFGSVELATPFQGVFRSLQEVMEKRQILRDVAIEKGDHYLAVELSSVSFYQNKSADFTPAMLPVLEELVGTLKQIDYLNFTISIEGHTNDIPVDSGYFPSNWELSSARAARLARFLIEHGTKPGRIKVVGYGDTHPKVPNRDINGKPIPANQTQNERVVIALERVK